MSRTRCVIQSKVSHGSTTQLKRHNREGTYQERVVLTSAHRLGPQIRGGSYATSNPPCWCRNTDSTFFRHRTDSTRTQHNNGCKLTRTMRCCHGQSTHQSKALSVTLSRQSPSLLRRIAADFQKLRHALARPRVLIF